MIGFRGKAAVLGWRRSQPQAARRGGYSRPVIRPEDGLFLHRLFASIHELSAVTLILEGAWELKRLPAAVRAFVLGCRASWRDDCQVPTTNTEPSQVAARGRELLDDAKARDRGVQIALGVEGEAIESGSGRRKRPQGRSRRREHSDGASDVARDIQIACRVECQPFGSVSGYEIPQIDSLWRDESDSPDRLEVPNVKVTRRIELDEIGPTHGCTCRVRSEDAKIGTRR